MRTTEITPHAGGPDPRVFLADAPAPFRAWTTREIAVLRARYETEGPRACLPELPGRSLGSIYLRANALGLRAPRRRWGKRQHWFATEAIDARIRQVYQSAPKRDDVNRLARELMMPRWWVSKRASVLGLVAPRFIEPAWSAPEIDLLRAHAHKHPSVIRRALARAGYRRTETAIVVKTKRLDLDTTDPDHYTANQAARLFGVDSKTVTRWILTEALPAKRRGTERTAAQGGDQWWIHRRALRGWIAAHAQLVDLRKVDRFWFIDLLAGGPGDV